MQAAPRPDWLGRTVACIASGPSLTQEDCEAVRSAGLPTIVTNTSFRIAPWADILFGFDARWWREHLPEVRQVFRGRLITGTDVGPRLGIETTHAAPWFTRFGNSGACAISLAISARAARILLLGFDCRRGPLGEAHWHGDHPKGMSNCHSMQNWHYQFEQVAKRAAEKQVKVINCSRRTALKCFARGELQQALQAEAQTA